MLVFRIAVDSTGSIFIVSERCSAVNEGLQGGFQLSSIFIVVLNNHTKVVFQSGNLLSSQINTQNIGVEEMKKIFQNCLQQ